MEYNVLWIDDEWKKQDAIIGEAEQEGINITPFESHEEGIESLKRKLNYYHAVILDAKVKNLKNDTVSNLTGLVASRDYLIELNKDYYMPYFIFTGQPDFAKADWFKESYGLHFIKGIDNDKLYCAIKDKVKNKFEFLVYNKYKEVLNICTNKYIGEESRSTLMEALKIVEGYEEGKTEGLLNPIRKIIESIFFKLNQLDLIPNDVFNEKGWINKSNLFIAGKHNGYVNRNSIPPIINFFFETILKITQDASHSEGSLNLSVDKYIKSVNTPYLYNSIVFNLLEIILWVKTYIDENPNKEINKLKYEKLQINKHGIWIDGIVIQISDNGWGNFQPNDELQNISIPPKEVIKNSLEINMIIKVKTKPSPDGAKSYIDEIDK